MDLFNWQSKLFLVRFALRHCSVTGQKKKDSTIFSINRIFDHLIRCPHLKALNFKCWNVSNFSSLPIIRFAAFITLLLFCFVFMIQSFEKRLNLSNEKEKLLSGAVYFPWLWTEAPLFWSCVGAHFKFSYTSALKESSPLRVLFFLVLVIDISRKNH